MAVAVIDASLAVHGERFSWFNRGCDRSHDQGSMIQGGSLETIF